MRRRIFWIILLGLAAALRLHAQFIWTGDGATPDLIFEPNNWQGNVAPGGISGTEDISFGDISPTSHYNILTPTSSFRDINFGGSDRPYYTFIGDGPSTLTLNRSINVASGPEVVFDSNIQISLTSGAHPIAIVPGTTLHLLGDIVGSGGLTLNGGGLLHLLGTNSYGGDTIVHQGTLSLESNLSLLDGTDFTIGELNGDIGTLEITGGATLENDTSIIGNLAGSTGSVILQISGTTWNNRTYLYVGGAGTGSLEIYDGATVSTPDVSIGNNTGGSGTLLVSGAGSTLDVVNTLYAGSQGLGILQVENGASVTSTGGSIGNNAGGTGVVTVIDAGSSWVNAANIIVGGASTGSLTVSDGAIVTTSSSTVASNSGVQGTLSVVDGGTFNASGNLIIGDYGTGTLYMSGGGQINTGGTAAIGTNPGSYSIAYIGDPTTQWTIGNTLTVGDAGQGALFLFNGAKVSINSGAGTLELAANVGSTGDLYLGYDGEGYSAGGIVNAATINSASGPGTIFLANDNDSGSPYYLTRDGTSGGTPVNITGYIQVQALGGYNVLAGNNTYSGGTVIYFGTVVAASNNALGGGSVDLNGGSLRLAPGVVLGNVINFNGGGSLSGTGTFSSNITVANGGRISPGNSPGTLNFSNGLTFGANGGMNLEVQYALGAAGTGYDTITVGGAPLDIAATNGTPFKIFLFSLDNAGNAGTVTDFSSGSAFSWTIATSSSGITNFAADKFLIDTSNFSNSLGTGSFSVAQSGNTLLLNFTPVPEPSTYVLLLLGVTAFFFRRRR